MLKLIGTDNNRYYAWNLEPGKYSIGRKTTCDFVIDDKTVSRKHAELEISPDLRECFLTDLGSHNGTMINGSPLTDRKNVAAGDHIQFGQTEFKISTDETSTITSSKSPPTPLSSHTAEKSVLLSMAEALQPLPTRVADRPELLPTLFDMAAMLVLPEPREVMLNRSLGLVSKLIPADRLAVLMIPENSKQVHTAASHLTGGKDPGAFNLSQTIVNEILTEKSAVLITDAKEDPRFAEQKSIIMSEMKSAMAVPLFDEDKVLGILYADTTNPAHHYNDDYLRLFATVGNIIASRLNNYTLLKERQQKQVFEAELLRASMIQKNLLPAVIPEVSGYSIQAVQEQCRSVGGDLYDLELLPDGRLLFLVADISGKGLGAAILMSNILASFRIIYNDESFELMKLVRKVSVQLFKHSAPEHFATLFVGLIDPKSHRMTYINAGHNPPIVMRQSAAMEFLEPSGPMIGIFDSCPWAEESIDLLPGDQLVIFTDGVTEAGAEVEEYSDERLEKLIKDNRHESPQSLAKLIMTDVDEFVVGAARSDDITMVLIKRDK
ncbi:MAG: SpoIIE family protein phosphatase [FCB group bacterium]|nr:SpoIIE family protein phosphatase [FCB group bacterium]